MIIITIALTIMALIVCGLMFDNGNDGWGTVSGAGAVIFGVIDFILLGIEFSILACFLALMRISNRL